VVSDLPAGFVVRLLGPGGRPVGVGVLVGQRKIVTCAHVVNAALGRDQTAQDQPGEPVVVEFPLLATAGGGQPARLTARVRRWLAPPRERVARRVIQHFATGSGSARAAFPLLTDREREILEFIAAGKGNAAIAHELVLTLKTVRNHVSNIVGKLQVADRAAAIVKARDAGFGAAPKHN
jgi:DNA-binding CsgD family transcriptional regulator